MRIARAIPTVVATCALGTFLAVVGATTPSGAIAPPQTVFGLTTSNAIVTFDASSPATLSTPISITGLNGGEAIVAWDVRPATGEVFAVGVTGAEGRVYRIDGTTGAATQVGSSSFSSALPTGGRWSMDFNPVVDRIRLVHSSGLNLRLNPTNGALAATDIAISGGAVSGSAYDRPIAGTTATTLFAIDTATEDLNTIGSVNGVTSPNGGVLTAVGTGLGVVTDTDDVGFDISSNGTALATLSVGGVTGLYTINLTAGTATFEGAVGAGTTDLLDIAFAIAPPASMLGLTDAGALVRFNAAAPATVSSPVAVSGLGTSESIVAFDARPATGELMAVGVRGTEGRLYRLDATTGAAVQIGTTPFSTTLPTGGTWIVDFNPTVDRVRVIHSTGLNLRLNPNDGALAATDTAVSGGVASGAAYDRSVVGLTPTPTTLYALDTAAEDLNTIGTVDSAVSPNGGVLNTVGPLGVVTDSDEVGFDIAPGGSGVAALSVGGLTRLYTVSLTTGAATLQGIIGDGNLDLIDLAVLPQLVTGASQFTATAPTRLLDTRLNGQGGALAAGQTRDLQVTGVAGVPANATAVVINITGDEPIADGYVTAWPTGESRPSASNQNLATGMTRANLATVKVGTGGKVSLFSQSGTQLVVDIFGYHAAPTGTSGRFTPIAPTRLIDTRIAPNAKVPAGGTVDIDVRSSTVVPDTGVASVVVNLVADQATDLGYLTVYASGAARPITSNVNVQRTGGTQNNLAIVPLGVDGKITVYSYGGAHIVADIVGYFGDSTARGGLIGLYVPLSPNRILDSRIALGVTTTAPFAPNTTFDLQVAGAGGVPATGASAVVGNATVGTDVDGTRAGYLTVYPTGTARSEVSSVNVDIPGQITPSLTSSPLGADGKLTFYSYTGGYFVFDISGYYTS